MKDRRTILFSFLVLTIAAPVMAVDYHPFEKPQLLEPLEKIIAIRFPTESPIGEWLVSHQTEDVLRAYSGGCTVLLKPSGEFFVIRDGKVIFSGLWANWQQKFKGRRD